MQLLVEIDLLKEPLNILPGRSHVWDREVFPKTFNLKTTNYHFLDSQRHHSI